MFYLECFVLHPSYLGTDQFTHLSSYSKICIKGPAEYLGLRAEPPRCVHWICGTLSRIISYQQWRIQRFALNPTVIMWYLSSLLLTLIHLSQEMEDIQGYHVLFKIMSWFLLKIWRLTFWRFMCTASGHTASWHLRRASPLHVAVLLYCKYQNFLR